MGEVLAMPQQSFSEKFIPKKPKNKDLRTREYLTPDEVELLINSAKRIGRYGQRDAAIILIMFRHGLRVSEAVQLKWDQIELKEALFHVRRLKGGIPSVHPLGGDELRALRKVARDFPDTPYVFVSERKMPFTDRAIRHIIVRAGKVAKFGFPIHPHMLRHATGYYLANRGHDTRAIQLYLGHKCIQHTTKYTELSPERFKGFWSD